MKQIIGHRFLHSGVAKGVARAVGWKPYGTFARPHAGPATALVTVDVEPGYLEKDGKRVWFRDRPDAWVGAVAGVERLLDLFQRHAVRATFFVSPHVLLAPGGGDLWSQVALAGHEIGLHLHPADDDVLKSSLSFPTLKTGARFYSPEQRLEMLIQGRKVLESASGADVRSFRWGNWALISEAMEQLAVAGFDLDASVCPGLYGHPEDDRFYDWRTASPAPYVWQGREGRRIVELPITTVRGMKRVFRLDPAWGGLLQGWESALTQLPYLQLLTHSSEMVDERGRSTDVCRALEQWVSTMLVAGREFCTCIEEGRRWMSEENDRHV